jgi:NAD(P)-dependent dehydrogenase (short-subunit alcohol dehydrogenase family)
VEHVTDPAGQSVAGSAIVAGGGSGIGRCAALRLAASSTCITVADVDGARADAVAEQIRRAGGRAVAVRCDVRSEADVERMLEASIDAGGEVATLVTSAGIGGTLPTHEMSLARWREVIDVNLTGSFLCMRAALPSMLRRGAGAIVSIGSVAAVVAGAGPGTVSYAASKAGVLALTRGIAVEYATRGIRANCVLPGPVATAFGSPEGVVTRGLDHPTMSGVRPPVGRRAEPEEISGMIAFLASDEASFITGAAIAVDGGFTAV